jgi:hypothetical protein
MVESLLDEALTYQATDDPLDPMLEGPNVMLVGVITTPANGAGDTSGDPGEGGKIPPEILND